LRLLATRDTIIPYLAITMNKKLPLLLLLIGMLLVGCGEKFDYRYPFTGTFEFTYVELAYYQNYPYFVSRTETSTIEIDPEKHLITFDMFSSSFDLYLDRDDKLFLADVNGNAGLLVGKYVDEDNIDFYDNSFSLGSINEYFDKATRVP
jgi:hypothetical protein